MCDELPAKKKEVFSGLELFTDWVVRVINGIDAMEEGGERGVAVPGLRYSGGRVLRELS